MNGRIFLSATWEYLAMFNYEVEPAILKPYLPAGTEIDFFNGKALVSVVGFLFNNTRVLGIQWPLHTHFEEVNLRYYIKRFDGREWRRGVGFISEIVPKQMIASLANLFYNEHYSCARMQHEIKREGNLIGVTYQWQKRGSRLNSMEVKAMNDPLDIEKGSEEEFIFEHYYGYSGLNSHTTIEYAVEHPRWKIYPVTASRLDCDVEGLYGKTFGPFISHVQPRSVYLARGSEVSVRRPLKFRS